MNGEVRSVASDPHLPSDVADSVRHECGICWWVYDPGVGDALGQVPAGVAFADLPAHWRCPECDAEPAKFLAVGLSDNAGRTLTAPVAALPPADLTARLVAAYRARDHELRGLPVHHPMLDVEAVGFHSSGGVVLGVMITPWCMNLVRIDEDARRLADGEAREYALPAGSVLFHAGDLPGFGPLEQASLFSPMTEFADQAAARAVAEEALRLVLTPVTTSRRELLTGGSAGER